jgi:SAM-dependent MidA family methyltransferase
MTRAGESIAAEIARSGPMPFHRFMEVSLYHPEHGYYRRGRDPFGKDGDFFTAEQVQPVFGILMAAYIRELYRTMGELADFTVVELGAGRGEMAEAFAEWSYIPVEFGGAVPENIQGVVFCNEFFDALPVDVAVYQGGAFLEQCVAVEDGRFVWRAGGPVRDEVREYFLRYCPQAEEGHWYEANLDAFRWIERIGLMVKSGYLLTIDYGYTRTEVIRYPSGTLMGYHRHTALEDVLQEPGERDITAHVNFTALQEQGTARGFRTENFQTLAQMLLGTGESDQFAAALGSGTEAGGIGGLRRRGQLKTLLFGMGETFRVMLQRKRSDFQEGFEPDGKV